MKEKIKIVLGKKDVFPYENNDTFVNLELSRDSDELVNEIIKHLVVEDTIVPGKTIAIYPGRFQPFGPHHKKVFTYLQNKFGDVYIATSNKSDSNRHPLNFKQRSCVISIVFPLDGDVEYD